MTIAERIGTFIDRWYLGVMALVAPVIISLNWYALGMAGLLSGYRHYKEIISQGFEHADLITFPIWGYGWLMLVAESKWGLIVIQFLLAFLAFYYFVRFLEQEKFFPTGVIRVLKICMVMSLPWYAFHALRWPYSIAASLFLVSIVLFCKAVTYSENSWVRLMSSALCFGLLLNFRSDYWLMPLGFAFLSIIFFKTKRSVIQAGVWLFSIYTCLIPWAFYTKKACGHYLVTSTNSGHVMFIGLGNDLNNRWGIEPTDGDPLMHRIVDEYFKKYKHSTLDYEADQFLKTTFFSYIREYPWDYAKKCAYAFYQLMTGGFYPGEFFMRVTGPLDIVKGTCVRYVLLKAVCAPKFFYDNFSSMGRLIMHTISWFMGQYILLLSYILLPLTVYYTFFRMRSFFMLLVLAAMAYQTLLNSLCFHMSGYMSNLYILYLLNMLYGVSLAYEFTSDWYYVRFRRLGSVLESKGLSH